MQVQCAATTSPFDLQPTQTFKGVADSVWECLTVAVKGSAVCPLSE